MYRYYGTALVEVIGDRVLWCGRQGLPRFEWRHPEAVALATACCNNWNAVTVSSKTLARPDYDWTAYRVLLDWFRDHEAEVTAVDGNGNDVVGAAAERRRRLFAALDEAVAQLDRSSGG